MGFKRKREGYKEFRPRLSPTEMLIARIRPAIAQIGEPSRYAREGLMRSLVHDLGEVPDSNFPEVLETIRAVVYEQPHKIGYLGFVIAAAPANVSFIVLEMTHDETVKALFAGDLARFKLFFRFLCALHPVVSNTEVLTSFMSNLLSANTSDARVKAELYKTALLGSLYLPSELVSSELQEQFVNADVSEESDDSADFFVGDSKPYPTKHIGPLLLDAAKELQSNGWNANILAANPLKPVHEGLPPKPGQAESAESKEELKEEGDDYEPMGGDDSDAKREPDQQPEEEEEKPKDDEEMKGDEPKENKDASKDEEGSADQQQNEAEQITKHTLRPLHLPDPLEFRNPTVSPAFFRCYLPLEDNIPTVPAENTVGGILLRDVAIDNMRHMDFNRREVTRQLIALDVFFSRRAFAPPGAWLDQIIAGANESPAKPTWKVEDIALESIFGLMFDLDNTSDHPLVYYHSLLIEACVMAPQDIAPVLGRGIRFMFSHLETADVELLFRLVDWFSHHVSNFAFTWKWNEWMDALSLPKDHPQLVFIKELLSKEVRLSYPQRVRDVLPEEFLDLVPTPPDVPPFKYSGNERAENLVEHLRSGDIEQARSVLESIEDSAEQVNLLVHTVCHLGNRSVTHATTWIAKSEELLREFVSIEDPVSTENTVNAVFEHWADASWIGALVINQFIKAQLVKPEAFVRYIVSHQDLLLSSFGWETLMTYIFEAEAAMANLHLEGEYSEWWTSRLQKAIKRISLRERAKAQLEAENLAQENKAKEQAQQQAMEESKPEETKPEDGDVEMSEEPQAKEPQAEEPRAEEPQAEEPKPEEEKPETETNPSTTADAEEVNGENDNGESENDEPRAKRQKTAD